ncbi:MAG: hypothetical protein IT372_01685 [Polyangiaceae bacterium]|nr:hypothetical protein [Polyangiaceae bacterium]
MRRRRIRRALWLAGALLLLHAGLAPALDALGAAESLLGPDAPRAALVLVLTVAFFAARLLLLFAAPGLLAAALVLPEESERR